MTRAASFAIALSLCAAGLSSPAAAQTFRRPLACDSCISNWFYFDQDSDGGVDEDWACQSSSYDGHRGTDFSLSGGNGAISGGWDVVAGADGTVVSTQDGHYDRCSTCNSGVDARCGTGFGFGFGNHVVVNHGSYRVVYAHLRTGSVTVSPGQTVTCGQVIGEVGSSGCTTGAHLHFETRPLGAPSSMAFDPYAGACSPTSPTLWTNQGGHRALPGPECDGTPTCPAGTFAIWTCNGAQTSRRRCIDGNDMMEPCPWGCVSMPVGTDDVCAAPPDGDGDGSTADVDCDDADGGRFPGNPEICGDGTDQDCDGADLVCPGTDAGPPVDAGPPRDAGMAVDAGAPVDAGAAADAGALTDAAIARDAGRGADAAFDAGPSGSLTGGCSCRSSGRSLRTTPATALWMLLAFVVRRRTRRRC